MSNDHPHPEHPDHQPDEHPDPNALAPQRGWGGEYDSDTTAFIEFPPGGLPGEAGDDPLAAPGHGYQPPDLGQGHGQGRGQGQGTEPLPTPGATTDPAETGQWTMPFAYGAEGWPAAPGGAGAGSGSGSGVGAGALGAAAMGQGAAVTRGTGRDGGDRRSWEMPPADEASPAHAPWSEPAEGVPHPALTEPVPGPSGGAPPPVGGAPAAEVPAARTEAVPVPSEPEAGADAAPAASRSDHPEVSYVLRVNGVDRPVSGAWIGESLLYVLRERLGLAGAKDGCSQGECGACSVQVDGRLVAACLVPAATVAGSEIRTVEGLGGDGGASDVQRALAASAAVQCGFCLPGMAMTVHDLLEGNHAPTELETREALSGNLCRCSGYRAVLDAVRDVVNERAALAETPADGPGGPGGPGGDERQTATVRIPHQAGPPSGDVS
ncbi:(2Fe-2S)-binding protein [Streptomyces sp. 6N223]|uniref:(2Fe-2S)-binding protein n=1 Tax=Streptomyces sp. 6N223 TaxID=3457412 RepID=UPI003FD24D6E